MQLQQPVGSSHLSAYEDGTDSVPKRGHIKFRRRGVTQKKAYKIQEVVSVLFVPPTSRVCRNYLIAH